MTAEAVLFEAGCDLLIGRIGFEKCPSPSITPQRVIGEPILGVLDHHEPHNGLIRSPTGVACSHLGVIGRERFFNEYGSVGELAVFSVILSRARRSIGDVHFSVTVGTGGSIGSEKLVKISNVGWLANIAYLVDQVKAVERLRALRMQRGVGDYDRKRKDYLWYATSHILFLLIERFVPACFSFGPGESLAAGRFDHEGVHEHGHTRISS